MKLYTALSLVGLGLGIVGLTATQACSSSSSSAGGGDTSQPGKQPPAKPDAPATTDSSDKTFAVNQLFLGESDRSGNPNKDAWKSYGYNLDGKISTKDSTDVCQRQSGASPSNQDDGDQGVDNAFGKVIIPFLQPFTATPSKTLTDSLTSGDFTIMLKIHGLTDDAAQTNTGLSGTLLIGAPFSKTAKPTFTPSDDWPYRMSPQVQISDAYINKGTFVNGSGGATIQLSLSIQGQTLSLNINKAIVTFDHTGANDATNGTIAGVIATDELVNGIKSVAGNISMDLCNGSTLDSIIQTIKQASDILADGTNTAGVPCSGISVGIGFTAKKVANPTMPVTNPVDAPSKCDQPADAGSDAGGDQ
ncbi:MAG TPA: hypothetical protein VIF62_24150 [Labilithrix sp.]|jgi:hypothetical protein